jgi:hypothetical protein
MVIAPLPGHKAEPAREKPVEISKVQEVKEKVRETQDAKA